MHCNTWDDLTFMTCLTKLFEIELFDHLTVYKQMIDV